MTSLDTRLRARALALIAKYGRDVAVQGKPTAYSVSTGATTPGAALGTVKAVVDVYDRRYVDGTNVRATDLKLLIAAADAEELDEPIQQGQVVTVDGRELKIVSVRPYSSGEQDAALEVQVRA